MRTLAFIAAAVVGLLLASADAHATDVWRKVGVGYSAGYHAGDCAECAGGAGWLSAHDKQYYQTPPNWTQESPFCPWPRRRPMWWFPQCVAAPRRWPIKDTVDWKTTEHWYPPSPGLGYGHGGPVMAPSPLPMEYLEPVPHGTW